MRVVISGTHATGKSTLASELAGRLAGYTMVEESYHVLEAEGHVFAPPMGADDFESLVEHSTAAVASLGEPDAIFDRGPLDYLAYLAVVAGDAAGVMHDWWPRVQAAVSSIDLFIHVPVEDPDRMAGLAIGARTLRRRVDAILRASFLEDAWHWNLPVLSVSGSPATRTRQALDALRARP